MNRVAVYGLGLIGGSVAQALRASNSAPEHLVGIDVTEVVGSPEAEAFVDELVDVSDDARVQAALATCEVTILALPVRAIERALPLALAACPVVTDCGSTKRSITAVARATPHAQRFVGGHPLAGSPEGGLANARSDLFVGSRWILCPDRNGTSGAALEKAYELVVAVGAIPVELSPEEHDHAVALTSHVPQLLASALLSLAAESGADVAAGPAFIGATRVAGGPEMMWRDIFETNGDEVASALAALSARLDAVGRSLPDVGPALELLRDARARRSSS